MRDPRWRLYVYNGIMILGCLFLIFDALMPRTQRHKIGHLVALETEVPIAERLANIVLALIGIVAACLHTRLLYDQGRKWDDDGKDGGDFPLWRRRRLKLRA